MGNENNAHGGEVNSDTNHIDVVVITHPSRSPVLSTRRLSAALTPIYFTVELRLRTGAEGARVIIAGSPDWLFFPSAPAPPDFAM